MEEIPKPVKKKSTRKPISPEKKAELLERLKRAREVAAKNRKEKKELKDAKKKKEKEMIQITETPTIIEDEPKKAPAKPKAPVIDPRDAEIERLRNQVKTFNLQDIAKKSKAKPKPKSKRADTPPPSPIENELITVVETPTIIEDEPRYVPPKQKAEPKPPPPAPSQPQIQLPQKPQSQTVSIETQKPPVRRVYKAFRNRRGY